MATLRWTNTNGKLRTLRTDPTVWGFSYRRLRPLSSNPPNPRHRTSSAAARSDLADHHRGVFQRLAFGLVIVLAGCTSSATTDESTNLAPREVDTSPPSQTLAGASREPALTSVTAPPTTAPSPATAAAPVTTEAPATVQPPAPAAAVAPPGETTPYVLPVADVDSAGWGDTHSAYPAADIFVGCGALLVSPVNGVVTESRRINAYDPSVDNPATRGGRSVAIIGDDGVRYYMAHFESIEDGVEPGARVNAGQPLGKMGDTGRASACHVHFGISPPCPGKEWSVRRGVIWPSPYLAAWRNGEQRSPTTEVRQWVDQHPAACTEAMADPHAPDS